MKEHIELVEIWRPVESGGEVVRGGKNYKISVIIANNYPVFIEDGFIVEKRPITEAECANIIKNSL